MSICVIFNPYAGRRRARRRLARFLERWQQRVELWPTEFAGHGVDLGRKAAEAGFAVIAAAGGDGTAHDVANGLLTAGSRDACFAVVPIGSANDYAYSLNCEFGPAQLDDESGHWVDVGQVSSSDGRRRYFIEALGLGLCGMVTLESRRVERLQGPLLYGLAAWRALRCDAVTDLQVQWDDDEPGVYPTLMLSALVGRREGNFLMGPEASLCDGLLDYVHTGRVGRWEVTRMLPRLYLAGPPKLHPQVRRGRCRRLRVSGPLPLTVHTDGELYSTPDDGVCDLEIELLPGQLRAKVCPP